MIFVRRVVSGMGCDSVCYDTQMSVRHADLDSIMSHYRKIYTYEKFCSKGRRRAKWLGSVMQTCSILNRSIQAQVERP